MRVWKLFARHIPIKEHVEHLTQEPMRPVINVFVGTPNRVKALVECDAVNLGSKKLKSIVFDCKPNVKGFSIFETHETRDDTFALMLHAQKQLKKRKIKVFLS